MNTERIEKFVNAIACDLEEGGFRQVSGTTLRRTLATAVSAALPLLADTGIPASQPAALAEQQGAELPPLPDKVVVDKHLPTGVCIYGYTTKQMQDYARATLAGTGKQQVGEVQGNALVGDEMVQAFKAALSHAQLPGKPRTYFLKDSELPSILREVLAARQPGADEPGSPMAKMAAALREKAAIEHTEYSQRVQSGEWGPMPEAGTQADFCRYCEGSGWDGESRKTKCPACSGTGMPVPPAQGIDLGQLRSQVLGLTRRVEPISGQRFSYVQLDDVLALIDQRDAAPGVGNG